jgi:hypothetical protein
MDHYHGLIPANLQAFTAQQLFRRHVKFAVATLTHSVFAIFGVIGMISMSAWSGFVPVESF